MVQTVTDQAADNAAYRLVSDAISLIEAHRPNCRSLLFDILDRLERPEAPLPPPQPKEIEEDLRQWVEEAMETLRAYQDRLNVLDHTSQAHQRGNQMQQ